MTITEKETIFEIQSYKKMILETNSKTRKFQLQMHINKLKKELQIYRFYRYKTRAI